MTQGELEQIPLGLQRTMSELELRIMTDIVRRIENNGFSGASADWQINRLKQLGMAQKDIERYIQEAMKESGVKIDEIFSDKVYEEYYGHSRAYQNNGVEQIPYEENEQLQQLVEGMRNQTEEEFRNMTGSLGFAIRDPSGKIQYSPLRQFYESTLDSAMMDIHSGAFDYQTVLTRVISQMTNSGLRWIDYDSGWHNRVDVAARRAVMTGFRQIQGKINEQVANELNTDMYEVTFHVGARPEHQEWQGRVYSMDELISVCGLGDVTGLHGANCYHDYKAFPPGSVRTYTDEQLEKMNAEENKPKTFNGREYTTYEGLQMQRKMETAMRATRQQIHLLKEGKADEQTIIAKKAKYQGQMQTYKAFSQKLKLPEQKERILQDGLKGRFLPTQGELKQIEPKQIVQENGHHTRNGNESVNWKVVRRKEYNEKFSFISDNPEANALATQRSRNALSNRDGKKSEELYAISLTRGKEISKITDQYIDFAVNRTEKFNRDVNRADDRGEKILIIHNHPHSSMPSIADINELLNHKNAVGLIACHDGSLYYYTRPSKRITEFDIRVARRKAKSYNHIVTEQEWKAELAKSLDFIIRKI